eukprot:scaffold456839_cov43-Prasinocladus_malaysianus.AAC.1
MEPPAPRDDKQESPPFSSIPASCKSSTPLSAAGGSVGCDDKSLGFVMVSKTPPSRYPVPKYHGPLAAGWLSQDDFRRANRLRPLPPTQNQEAM